MEAARDLLPFRDPDRATGKGAGHGTARVRHPGVDGALAVLRELSSTAVEDAALFGFRAASDFAGRVEELSRAVEYLQLVAAGAVDRTRKQAAAPAVTGSTAWITGWRDTSSGDGGGSLAAAGPGLHPSGAADASGAAETSGAADAGPCSAETSGAAGTSVPADASGAADDGYRNTAEFLRARLRISAAEARRRLSLAEGLLPRLGLGGQRLPPAHEELGDAVASGEVASPGRGHHHRRAGARPAQL